jgi:hypothetical protein
MKIPFAAKIYITDKPEEARYKNSSFIIPGVMKVKRLVISKTYYSAGSALYRSLFKVMLIYIIEVQQ